ncbi:MAG: hypothetical protein FJ145_19310 [Deltaproteobacteria bacterium]|nr:hypothetical protein [Deltaproteobacteria bacterium]
MSILPASWLRYEALAGGWRNAVPDDATARGEHRFHAGAFLWVSADLLVQIVLINRAGFVLSQAVLFALSSVYWDSSCAAGTFRWR